MPETGKPEKLMDLKGSDLLGLPVQVQNSPVSLSCFILVSKFWDARAVSSHAAQPHLRPPPVDHPDEQGDVPAPLMICLFIELTTFV